MTASHFRILSEIIAGHVSGSPPPPLSAKERTGILPIDILKKNHKAIKLGLYGRSIAAFPLVKPIPDQEGREQASSSLHRSVTPCSLSCKRPLRARPRRAPSSA